MKALIILFVVCSLGGMWWVVYREAGPYTAGILTGTLVSLILVDLRVLRLTNRWREQSGPFESLKQSRASSPDRKE